MRKSLWALAGIALGGVGLLTWMSHSLVSSVAGVDEARGLTESFRASSGGVAAAASIRVGRTPIPGEGGGFLWVVTGDLLPGVDPEGAAFALFRERVVARALGTRIRGRAPAGLRILLRRGPLPPLEREFDAAGRPLLPAPRRAPAPAAPPAGAR